MKARLDPKEQSPDGMRAVGALHTFIRQCGLEKNLLELIKLRASQIHGCAHCIDMHAKELRAAGESEQRVYLLSAWRESPHFTQRERLALAWTEAVTLIPATQVSDDVYEEARQEFSAPELVNLTLAIVAINSANRINIAFRTVPGSHAARAPLA